MKTRSKVLFRDRKEAGSFLWPKLLHYQGLRPLVLAVPRGGVPLGSVLARRLGGDLDLVLVHKLGSPGNPETAIGALGEGGHLYTAPYLRHLEVPPPFLQEEVRRQARALEQKRKLYTPHRQALSAAHRVVILVDDGIATGATLLAAIREVESQRPAKVVVAAAVAPPEALEVLKQEADEVVVLAVRPDFRTVGEYFSDFTQVTDEEVIAFLEEGREGTRGEG